MRGEIIASPPLKLLDEMWSPIGSIVLQAVAEDGIGRMIYKCFQQPVPDSMQMSFKRILIVVVENKSLSPNRWALYGHSGPAGDEKNRRARRTRFRGDPQAAIFNHPVFHLLCPVRVQGISRSRCQENCREIFARSQARHGNRARPRRNWNALHSHCPSRLRDRNVRAAKGPAAAQ